MKLIDAIVMGRFCGLQTVGECILNIDLHYWDLIPPSELAEAQKRFAKDIRDWEAGKYEIDEEYIKQQLERLEKAYGDPEPDYFFKACDLR